MNSFKSTVTILLLLGVSYGVYRLIHTPDPTASTNAPFFLAAGPSTPNANPMDAPKLPTAAPFNAIARSNPTPPAPKSFAPPAIPKIEAPDLAKSSSAPTPTEVNPPSAYQRELNSPTEKLVAPPSTAKLIATIPPPSKSMPVGGTTASAEIDADVTTNVPAVMTGPLTAVSGPETVAPQAKLNENIGAKSASPLDPKTSVAGTPNAPPASSSPANNASPVQDLKSVWPIVDAQVRKGEIAQALQLLSGYYNASLSETDRTELLKWLDALAFKVIYSTEDRLSPTPHVVKAGETLESIAKDWSIPKELLLNINRSKIPADNVLIAGLELKIVRGPFRAEIDSQRNELTLFLDRCYAGRFAIDTTHCQNLKAGQLAVQNLQMNSPGQYRLELEGGLCLTAGASPTDATSIRMDAADAKDVFNILSANSQVTVIR